MHDIEGQAFAALERVTSRATFLIFVDALCAELAESNRRPRAIHGGTAFGWENTGLVDFLDAMHRWGMDADGRDDETPTWRALADFLWVGKIYE